MKDVTSGVSDSLFSKETNSGKQSTDPQRQRSVVFRVSDQCSAIGRAKLSRRDLRQQQSKTEGGDVVSNGDVETEYQWENSDRLPSSAAIPASIPWRTTERCFSRRDWYGKSSKLGKRNEHFHSGSLVVSGLVEKIPVGFSSSLILVVQSIAIRTTEFSVGRSVWPKRKTPFDTRRIVSVWFRLMFPYVENSSYRQFVIEVLSQLTKWVRRERNDRITSSLICRRNLDNKKFFKSNERFNVESYVELLDLIDRAPPSLSKESRSTLSQSATNLGVTTLTFRWIFILKNFRF